MLRELDPKRACTPHLAGRTAPHPAAVFPLTLSRPRKGRSLTTSPVPVSPEIQRETPPMSHCPSPPGACPISRPYPHAALAQLILILCQTPPPRVATLMAEARPVGFCPASFLGAPARNRAPPLVPIQPRDLLTLGLRRHPHASPHLQPENGKTLRRS